MPANRWTGACLRRTSSEIDGSFGTRFQVNTGSCEDWTSRQWLKSSSGEPSWLGSAALGFLDNESGEEVTATLGDGPTLNG
ncbi:hypothetical protein GCM10022224_097900 [Nonomuraea antimicrobica]|uniref:Uncharacterized protein n=1 Tax=Nonomuraea antimicrobica TaxID=561173 RepID=A0ABP7EDE6_9ACTN